MRSIVSGHWLSEILTESKETKMAFKSNLIVCFMSLLLSVVLSVSMEQKYAELEKEFESLRDNVTAMRSEMVAADVLRLYLNQEISFRNHLEQQMNEMVKNYSNIESLYQSTLSELQNAKREVNELNRKYTDVQRNTNHSNQRLEEVVKNNTDLQGLYQSTMRDLNDLNWKYTEFQNNTSLLQSNLTDQQLMLERSISDQKHCKSELNELKSNYSVLQKKQDELQRDILSSKDALSAVSGNQTVIHDLLSESALDFQRNISVLRLLYEDDLQQTYDLRRLHDVLQQEVRHLAVSMVETKDDLDSFNRSLRIELEGELRLVEEDIARLNGTNQAIISKVQTDLEKFTQGESKISFSVGLSRIRSDLTNKVIPYDIVDTNTGSGYDNNTGIFTAPMAGNYVFSWNSFTEIGYSCRLYLYRNGVRQEHGAYTYFSSSYFYATPSSAILTLMRGDRIWIQGLSCNYLNGSPFSYFIGFKL